MSRRSRLLFFLVAWAIVLMPFLFWRGTWFGRPLSDSELQRYLHDDAKPRRIQHALVQVGDRLSRKDPSATRWYPELVRLSSHPVEEIRNTDAWVMGQDISQQQFHDALLKMLNDPSQLVRSNAALSLVRFGDPSGHEQIVSMLHPARLTAPDSGRVTDAARTGTSIRQGGTVVKLDAGSQILEVRSPLTGRVRSAAVQSGDEVSAGVVLATVDPGADQVWEALRALYIIGQPQDIPVVAQYQRPLPDLPDRVRAQANETEKAIRARAR
jgi:HEAT repeat protein